MLKLWPFYVNTLYTALFVWTLGNLPITIHFLKSALHFLVFINCTRWFPRRALEFILVQKQIFENKCPKDLKSFGEINLWSYDWLFTETGRRKQTELMRWATLTSVTFIIYVIYCIHFSSNTKIVLFFLWGLVRISLVCSDSPLNNW